MTVEEILDELETMVSESYKKLLFKNYGVKGPCFGVKIGDRKQGEFGI
jgi:hypothetical protein